VKLSRETLIGLAHAERERLGRSIQYAPAGAWDAPSACEGWRNRDIVAHLAAQDTAAAQLVGREPPAEFDAFREANDGDLWVTGFNEWAVEVRKDVPARQVIIDWGRAADVLLHRVTGIDPADWDRTNVEWFAGEIGVRYLVQSRTIEWWIHGEDIREGTSQEPNLQHWPIYLTNDMAIRMLPYSLAQANLSYPGRSLEVVLEGMGGGSWHWGLAPRESPPEDKKPDAFVHGRAYPFALVAWRRAPAEAFLDDGNLVIGGDEEVALAVLRHLHAFVE
jgi:uncharacterized protein (TIGR03083 family)